VIAVDGTKIKASASRDQNRSYEGIVAEILDEAERTDREEDERHGGARGDELPERFRSRESRRAALAEAKQRLDEQQVGEEREASEEPATGLTSTSSGRWHRGMVVRAGCVKVAAGWMNAASESSNLLRGRGPSVWPGPSADWRKHTPWSGRRMRPMRTITHARSAATGDGSRPQPLARCQRCPRAGST
jgi:hypothetical protein